MREMRSDEFKEDESRSNPMAVAFVHEDCPVRRVCFHMVVGFGSVVDQCPHLTLSPDGEKAYCREL